MHVQSVVVPDICVIVFRGTENESTSGKEIWQEDR